MSACRSEWPDEALHWALDAEERGRYDVAIAALRELRSHASNGAVDYSMSEEETQALRRLGIRQCPQCSAAIQKQAEGLLTGCDKMTCRCGCMFCFKCGLVAAGGTARCRCVGAHHSFIPRSQVLDNYRLAGAFLNTDQDLTKRPKGKASPATAARLRKELRAIASEPPPYVHVRCDDNNILSLDFVIEGPPDTAYDGGWYWGRVEPPKDYPFFPPLIRLFTPSGRFQTDTWLCRTLEDYHPEGWQPSWTLASVLMALLSLMCGDGFTPGAVHPSLPESERKRLARESLSWNRQRSEFMRMFPEIDKLLESAAAARSLQ